MARHFRAARPSWPRVNKLCIFAGTTIGSYAFWALGDSVLGLGFGWSFVLSGVGSVVGVIAGWKLAQKLMS